PHDDVEFQILCVVPDGGAAERLLEVDVPTHKGSIRTSPEVPDRMVVAGTLHHQRAVPLPPPASPVPGVLRVHGWKGAGEETELGTTRQIGHQLVIGVLDDVDDQRQPRPTIIEHLAANNLLAVTPSHSRRIV